MPVSVDFHDLTVETFFVDVRAGLLRVTALDAHAPEAPRRIAECRGLSAYCLSGDLLGTIVSEFEERAPLFLYATYGEQMRAAFRATGGHAPWVESKDAASAYIAAHGLRGFELTSSVGGGAAIWCRECDMRVERSD